jgi:flagella basal body P-ring formation protein FlgA
MSRHLALSLVALAAGFAVGLEAAAPVAAPTVGAAVEEAVRAAIVTSVRARMGQSADVRIETLDIRAEPFDAAIEAVPDAGARVGGPVRFLLMTGAVGDGRRRVGSADVTVRVVAPHVRAASAIARGEAMTAAVLSATTDDVGRVPLQKLPVLAQVVGAQARRALAAGALITDTVVGAAPLVRSGDEVTTIVRVGGVEVRSRAIATMAAALGDTVRVVANRRSLRGRVVGAGEVEIQK